MLTPAEALLGALHGMAVGDALGLPWEGIKPQRAAKFWPNPALHHDFFFGKGMCSDDTEHACLTAQALLVKPLHSNDPRVLQAFGRSLQWKLKWWLASLPAGIGMATARSLLKAWAGFGPETSGVHSAGNGPAMRTPILGVCLANAPELLIEAVRMSTRITHTDPKAERGALWTAFATKYGMEHSATDFSAQEFIAESRAFLKAAPIGMDDELGRIMDDMQKALQQDHSVEKLAEQWGQSRGISGYMYHTVPVVLYAWLRSPHDYRRVVQDVIRLGGDADTTGAIAGGICGASVGASGIPTDWVCGIIDWPRSTTWMKGLADRLEAEYFPTNVQTRKSPGPATLFWLVLPIRNLLFLIVVLKHGFRRLLPPY